MEEDDFKIENYYQAPEEVFSKKSDIWSVGVCFFMMLTGLPPYNGETTEKIIKTIKNDDILYNLLEEN